MAIVDLEKLPGVMTVLGGLLLNMLAGNLNNWGALLPYVTSYLSSTNPQVSSSLVYNAQPFSFLAENLGVMLAPVISRKLGVRICLLLGGLLVAAAYLACSVISNPHVLVLAYSLCLGIGGGMISITSLWPSWEYFPESKGKITGIIMAGFSGSCMIFGLVFAYIANPYNIAPVRSGNDVLFGPEVDSNVPKAFFWIGFMFLVITIIGVALIQPRRSQTQTKSKPLVRLPVTEFLRIGNFWNLFFVAFTSFLFWYFIAGCYKSFGLLYIEDDHFLTYMGSVANIAGVFGRWFWPTLMDYVPFKAVMSLSLGYQFVASILIWYAVGSKATYAALIISLFFATAAHYPCIAVQTGKVFGELSDQAWPFVFIGVSLSATSTIFMKLLAESVGYFQTYLVQGCIILCSIFLSWRVQESCKLGRAREEFFEPLV